MSDPRNAAHAKKVSQEKKHHAHADAAAGAEHPPAEAAAAPAETQSAKDPGTLEGSLAVLSKLNEMEFHSRANIERLAEMMLTVEDELKQKQFSNSLGEVYSAQDAFHSKLAGLIEAYKVECEHLQSVAA